MAANQYKCGELFRRYHLQNIYKAVSLKKVLKSDNQADLPVLDEAEVMHVRTTKVRAWTPEWVELLLKYLKEYKVTCDFNGKDFEQDLSAMYTEIPHACWLISVMNSGLKAPLSLKSFEKMTSEEYQDYNKRLDKEQVLIKKGYDRVKEKIRNVR